VPLLHEPGREWKAAAFSQYPRGDRLEGYSIRTNRYRYVEWRRKTGEGVVVDAQELYDHRTDPLESVSVAAQPENRELVLTLAATLRDGWRGVLPPGIAAYGSSR
jgi:iduronate 2-sulfatase